MIKARDMMEQNTTTEAVVVNRMFIRPSLAPLHYFLLSQYS